MKWVLVGIIGGSLCFSPVALATPRLSVSEEVYDFGEVKEGVLVVHNFILSNVGDSVLTFTQQPKTTCGCTSAPLHKTSLAPGESIALEVRFESTGYGGNQVVRYVYVYSDDPEAPQIRLAIQGYVAPHALYEETAYMLRYRYRLILDVRDRQAFARGHLLGAVNVPVAEIPGAVSWLPMGTIYVCDAAGETGFSVAESLRRQGFWATRVLAGGLAGWTKELGDYLLVGEIPAAEPVVSPGGVSPSQLAQEYLIILDFRTPEAFAQEHLAGAIYVGQTGLDAILPHLLPATAQAPELQPYIFCVDEGEGVAAEAAQFLQTLGLTRAYALIGGLPQWRIRYGSDFMIKGS
ncbi:MAG: rhodanese-like domain-containing protein [Candidatus Bipolaricaulota bacterium]|nr:rhodanese-like domain-containing protein [Candidatus Bipolaricaulota bacterium]MDW8126531.1 rhodanese-like domain-containing protein [Candidatus Bipolaricaulota bacterium]